MSKDTIDTINQSSLTIDTISQSSGEVNTVICDGDRNNQAIFSLLDTEPLQPRLREEMGELICYVKGIKKIARRIH